MDSLLFLHQLEQVPGASFYTNTTAGASLFIHYRQIMLIHRDGVEGAGYSAGAKPQTPIGAHFRSPADQEGRSAVGDAIVFRPILSLLAVAGAEKLGNLSLHVGGSCNPHDLGDCVSHVSSAYRTPADFGFARGDSLGKTAAASETTGTTVGARENLFNGCGAGVRLHGKDSGGVGQHQGKKRPDKSHANHGQPRNIHRSHHPST